MGSSQTLCRSVLKLVFIVWVCMVGVYGGCVCVCVRDVRQMVDLLPVGRHWKEQEVHFHRCYSNC